jgi:hypothetical protein
MENLKIYILIKDPATSQDVSIRGNMDILRAFLSGVSLPVMQPITNPPATNDADPAQAGIDTNLEKGE